MAALEDHAAGPGEGRLDRSQLDQDLGTVSAVFYHPLYRFQMADGAGQAVYHLLCLGVAVDMAVGMAVGMSVLFRNSMFRMLCFVEF